MKRVFQTTDGAVHDEPRVARIHQAQLDARTAIKGVCAEHADDAGDAVVWGDFIASRAKELLPHIVRLAGE